jgi:hypothetical protein
MKTTTSFTGVRAKDNLPSWQNNSVFSQLRKSLSIFFGLPSLAASPLMFFVSFVFDLEKHTKDNNDPAGPSRLDNNFFENILEQHGKASIAELAKAVLPRAVLCFCIWVPIGFSVTFINTPKSVLLLSLLFFCAWLWVGKGFFRQLQRLLGHEWWLDITLEGPTLGHTGSEKDIHVGRSRIDEMLFIWGEPRTYWETRLQEPAAMAILQALAASGEKISLTGDQIARCAPPMREQVQHWLQHLQANPPTPQDWKDSSFDFSVHAKDKATAASHPGSPIAVPSLIDEDDQ